MRSAAEVLLGTAQTSAATFPAAVNVALFTTTPARFANACFIALAALRTALLPTGVPPVLLLLAGNLAIVLSMAAFYTGARGEFRVAARQHKLRGGEGGWPVVLTLFTAMGLGASADALHAAVLVLYALYSDSAVFIAAAVVSHVVLPRVGA